MARQSFIWTALPNGYTPDGTALRLSVLLTPRLTLGPTDPPTLTTFFPDWQDWPLTLSQARFEIAYNGVTVPIDADDLVGPNRVDDRLGAPDSVVWKALFKSALPVQSFVYQDLSNHSVLSYDAVGLAGVIQALYSSLAQRAGDDLPRISEIQDDRTWRALVGTILDNDQRSFNQDTGLRDPAMQRGAADRSKLSELFERFHRFHTPPATPAPRTEARRDDPRITASWLEYKQTELPKKADLVKGLDFHRMVSAMASYPTLLRRLGLVVDLLLDPAALPAAANGALSVKVVFPPGALQVPQAASAAAPVTRTLLSAERFRPESDAAAPLKLDDGLVHLDPARFSLLQVDVDGAGLKFMNFARSLYRRDEVERQVDLVTRHEDRLGAPALRTSGLTLVHTGRDGFITKRFNTNKTGNAALEGQFAGGTAAVELRAEDLVRGYRVDIWDSASGMWQSLCRRTARYELDDGAVVVDAIPEEEATIRLAATKSSDPASNPAVLYLHEAMVSWAGWSLAAPPPGRTIGIDDTNITESAAEGSPDLKFKSRFKAVKGSLPRLRFGRTYAIRLRAVDLAGNSLDPRSGDFGWEQLPGGAGDYRRYEPIESPIIALLSQGLVIEKPSEGESIARIAIRSFNDSSADNTVPTAQVGRRVAAPPRVSARDAEQHGMLDAAGKVDAATFQLLANLKDVDPRDPAAAIREELLPMKGPLEETAVDTTFAVYEAGRTLTYLPDPLANEIAVRVFDHPNFSDTEIINIPLYPSGGWPEARPFVIEVYDDPSDQPHFDAATATLRVPLPKGARARLRLSMKPAPGALDMMGIFGWLNDAGRAAQRDRALSGQHWMLTPWRVIELVHAVQRPLRTPEITSVTIHGRDFGSTAARPRLQVSCSIASTDRLDLFAEWHEPLDDDGTPATAAGPADRTRQDLAFHVKITDDRTYATRSAFPSTGGFPDHVNEGDDTIGINTGPMPPPGTAAAVQSKAHEFHDTRYRRIEYWFEATTRFREFLPSHLLTRSENGATVPDETRIKVTGQRAVSWIPNSAPPPVPRVLYVVPTFGWMREIDDGGTVKSWRQGGGLRVYLDRSWNVSGYGEMLAVVLPPASFAGDPDVLPKGKPYKDYITQWGNDPIWDSPFVAGMAPNRADFPRARTAPDSTGGWLPPGAPASERDQRPGNFPVTGLEPPHGPVRGAAVDIAPHDVFFDPDRRLWYADIEIKAGPSYFPFIRLALARYQPISSQHAHLSGVVLADVMALTADRWLNVTPTDDARRRRIAVFGARPYESSGHHEAEHAVSVSIEAPPGHFQTLTPAQMPRSTVVEVWVERLEARLGEDFGWMRVSDAIINGSDPLAAAAGGAAAKVIDTAISGQANADERLTARALLETSIVPGLVTAQLTSGLTQWRTLWEGDVVLPATPGRHRLVIAEYEEYLVDDQNPYDKTPTRKDRRLVFVEHIEIRG
jgi:hypothetical protein